MLKHLINYGCLGMLVVFGFQSVKLPSVKMPIGVESPAANKNVDILISAIIQQESNRQYNLVNQDSGALGYAQVMPDNVRPWGNEAAKALGDSSLENMTPQEYLNSPTKQNKVIRFKIGQYYKEALKLAKGDTRIAARMVASAWYSGQMNKLNDTRRQYSNGQEYPSIYEYTILAEKKAIALGYK